MKSTDPEYLHVTEEYLVARGLILPVRKAKPKPVNLFGNALTAHMASAPPTAVEQPEPPEPVIPGPEAAHAASDGPPPPIAPIVSSPEDGSYTPVPVTQPIGQNCPAMVSPKMAEFQNGVANQRAEREAIRERVEERQLDPTVEPIVEDTPPPPVVLPWEQPTQ
jgi:hypothetical protein